MRINKKQTTKTNYNKLTTNNLQYNYLISTFKNGDYKYDFEKEASNQQCKNNRKL